VFSYDSKIEVVRHVELRFHGQGYSSVLKERS